MKIFPMVGFLLIAMNAAASPPTVNYPSCQIHAQHAVTGQTDGTITDVRQAHISVRADILQADIATARKARRRLSQTQADALWQRVDRVRHDADGLVGKQGFLSAAERASYDRDLDDAAGQLCAPPNSAR